MSIRFTKLSVFGRIRLNGEAALPSLLHLCRIRISALIDGILKTILTLVRNPKGVGQMMIVFMIGLSGYATVQDIGREYLPRVLPSWDFVLDRLSQLQIHDPAKEMVWDPPMNAMRQKRSPASRPSQDVDQTTRPVQMAKRTPPRISVAPGKGDRNDISLPGSVPPGPQVERPSGPFAGTATAAPSEEGIPAYVLGDFPSPLRSLRPLAKQGDAVAQYYLGNIYDQGHGVAQDFAAAAKWYRKAADQGDAAAQAALGDMYAEGLGVRQDYAESFKWYRKAADRGSASAQFEVGLLYRNGQGVSPDDGWALLWFLRAADQGHADAQYQLGLLYYEGLGGHRDYVQAYKWFDRAASRFQPWEAEKRGLAARGRDLVASRMTQAQIAEAQLPESDWDIEEQSVAHSDRPEAAGHWPSQVGQASRRTSPEMVFPVQGRPLDITPPLNQNPDAGIPYKA